VEVIDRRLGAITSDSPDVDRWVAVQQIHVRPDGARLAARAELLDGGALTVDVGGIFALLLGRSASTQLADAISRVRPGGHLRSSRRYRSSRSPGGGRKWSIDRAR
jgi:hypothetical protein